ncbi:MAG: phosphonate ABC transporter ATP-binding protein [Betaproteobacteria bacterium]|nr:phosphonate ABC transporter ATP-binding protein [Betaproteobacteria bacterium]
MAIELNSVAVCFPGGVKALQPVSLRFERGVMTVLLGASGAGKSTLLRCLNLLTQPTSGTVSVDAIGALDSRRALHEHRKRTGIVFQQHQLIGRQTVLANVLLGRIGYHSAWRTMLPLPRAERSIALECIERVGLLHKALERVDRLSGGQQQRVGIARALAQQPRLMLADEPVASLDPASSRHVLAQLQRICHEDNLTTVVSLHQVDYAREYADRVIGLAHGRVIFDGSPAELSPAMLETIYEQPGALPGGAKPRVKPLFELATAEE